MGSKKSPRVINPNLQFETQSQFLKASIEIRDNPDFMTKAIEKFGIHVFHASSKRLRNDRYFILSTIERKRYWAEAFKYASQDIRNDPLFIEEALKANLNVFRYLKKKWRYQYIDYVREKPSEFFPLFPAKMRDDENLVMQVIKTNPENYRYASERLQNDPEIVIAAVMRRGSLLENVPEMFKDHNNVVYIAVSRDSSAFQYASPRLRDDEEIARMAIMNHPRNFQYASERIRDYDDLALYSMEEYGRLNYKHLSPRLQQYPEMMALKETFIFDDGFMGCQ